MAGRSTLAAPISWAGVVLSHPPRSTTPSRGFALSTSSTSIDIRLRRNMAVGLIICSPSEIVGNSRGRPPDSQTPRFTASATALRCALHGVSSDQLLAMPMTGRPETTSSGKPWRRRPERWTTPSRSCLENHSALRSSRTLIPSFSSAGRPSHRLEGLLHRLEGLLIGWKAFSSAGGTGRR